MEKPKRILRATHVGELVIGDLRLPCAVLEDGTRVLSEHGITNSILGARSGASKRLKEKAKQGGVLLPIFLAPGQLKPFITNDLLAGPLAIIEYDNKGKITIGYHAEILPIVCDIWLRAREAGTLQTQQLSKAQKAEILARSLAKVGIIALIDEATGYQYDRKYDALRVLVKAYIEEDLQPWVKTFPDSFFAALDKLYKNEKTTSRKRPQYYGKFINKYIYDPIEKGFIKKELDKKNITDKGKRKARFHQWFTGLGRNQLVFRIGKVEGLIDISASLIKFKENVGKLTQLSLFDLLDED